MFSLERPGSAPPQSPTCPEKYKRVKLDFPNNSVLSACGGNELCVKSAVYPSYGEEYEPVDASVMDQGIDFCVPIGDGTNLTDEEEVVQDMLAALTATLNTTTDNASHVNVTPPDQVQEVQFGDCQAPLL